MGVNRVCIVTDQVVGQLPGMSALLNSVNHENITYSVYDSVRTEPTDTRWVRVGYQSSFSRFTLTRTWTCACNPFHRRWNVPNVYGSVLLFMGGQWRYHFYMVMEIGLADRISGQGMPVSTPMHNAPNVIRHSLQFHGRDSVCQRRPIWRLRCLRWWICHRLLQSRQPLFE